MKFKTALGVDVGEDEQFHVFYKRSFCGRLKKGEKATEVNVKKLIIEHNGFYVCEVNSNFDWAVDLELRPLDFKYEKRSFEDGIQSKQAEIDEMKKRIDELELINFDSELHFDAAKEHIDHLQKRIDDAVNCLEQNKPSLKMDYKHAINALSILKGE